MSDTDDPTAHRRSVEHSFAGLAAGVAAADALPATATGKRIHDRATAQAVDDVAAGRFTDVRGGTDVLR